ncbi:MAG: sulfatase-like hydrolase/transferase [Lachnospiraceae bacterium]
MKEKYTKSLKIVLLPVLIYGLLGPLEIYESNTREFKFDFNDFFWVFLLMTLILVMLGTWIVAHIPEPLAKYVRVLIFAFGMMSYVQGMFLNSVLTTSDGSDVNWEQYRSLMLSNAIIWFAGFALMIVFSLIWKYIWEKVAGYVSLFLSAVIIVTCISLIVICPKVKDNGYQLDGSNQFQVAGDNNIIVMVLDRYGNEQFEKVNQFYPEISDCLTDFTYYDNAASRYSNTFPSMPYLMTGQYYDYGMDEEEWLTSIWQAEETDSFYRQLHDRGYQVHLYSPDNPYIYGPLVQMIGKIDNIEPMGLMKNYRLIYALLEKTVIYKYAPYFLKPRFEVSSSSYAEMAVYKDNIISDNGEYYAVLTENRLTIDSNMPNAFIVNHINGMHNPFTIDENANSIPEVEGNEQEMIQVTRGVHVILAEYLQQLKDLGVYDNATIIITADHGDYSHGGGLQPIFFVKLPQEQHEEMQRNSAPISHEDFLATILFLVGCDDSNYGTTIFDWQEGDRRPRMVDDKEEGTYYTDRYEWYRIIQENNIAY